MPRRKTNSNDDSLLGVNGVEIDDDKQKPVILNALEIEDDKQKPVILNALAENQAEILTPNVVESKPPPEVNQGVEKETPNKPKSKAEAEKKIVKNLKVVEQKSKKAQNKPLKNCPKCGQKYITGFKNQPMCIKKDPECPFLN